MANTVAWGRVSWHNIRMRSSSAYLLFTFCLTFAQWSSGLEIAVVDMTKVFETHPLTDAITKELTNDREASREEFKEKSNALKEILQKHQELIRAGKKTEAAEVLKKANEAEKEIATLRTTGLRDLEENFRKAKHRIMESIVAAVTAFNEDGKYSMIFDKSSASSNGLPQVVHSPGATDVTDEVIAFIKEQSKKKSAEKKP
ncbi:MAG: OmpH family outer membrane protein [Verrucomicrobiales bacterium]|nr:OmpH family outer membrane protein [Verrucomicrobiales bacterium]